MTTQTAPPLLSVPELGERLRSLAGAGAVRPAGGGDATAGVSAHWVVEPRSDRDVASLLQFANDAGLSVIPRGGGSKLSWGNPPQRADVVLCTSSLHRIVEHTWADMTVTVEAGCTLAELQRALAKHGQRLAADPLWPERATVGGILSTNDTGALRFSYGGLRDLVIGLTLVLPDGTIAKSGGKVVKNVAGYDLPKLATGALGTLGVITQAIFRVHPLPAGTQTLQLQPDSLLTMQRTILELLNSDLPCAQMQACLASGAAPLLYLGLEGTAAGLAAQEKAIRELAQPMPLSVATAEVWRSRQDLWTPSKEGHAAVAKLSVLPSKLMEVAAFLDRLAQVRQAQWSAVLQGTGIGWLRVEAAEPASAVEVFCAMRTAIESGGGSLTIAPLPSHSARAASLNGDAAPASAENAVDFWGGAGDTLPLMAAVKQQFDPRRTLNPGRFLGGI